MTQAATKGVALEFGRSPHIRSFVKPEDVFSSHSRRVLYAINSGAIGRKLLLACQSMRERLERHQSFPVSVVLTDLRLNHLQMTPEQMVESIRKAAVSEQVVLLCSTELTRWSAAEKSEFHHELESAIDFLSRLASADSAEQGPLGDADSERSLQLARERRDQLLRDERWIDAPTVHVQQGGRPDSQGINNTASRLRRGGELLGAWNGREFLHPTFQFRPDTGRLMPEMKTLLDILPKDRSGWRQALWLFQRHGQLDGKRPADVFQKDSDAVIKAARSDFELNDERW